MPEEHAPGAHPHNDKVKYVREQMVSPNLARWEVSGSGETLQAEGPCPKCYGAAWGPPLPEAEAPLSALLSMPPIDSGRPIIAECHCGYDHGANGEKTCGRLWYVPASHGI
jgi:hypothetical protein